MNEMLCINALRDFRNTFTNCFLRDNKDRLIAMSNKSSITISYKHDDDIIVEFVFIGDSNVKITCTTGEAIKSISCKCAPDRNTRDKISNRIMDKFGIILYL